MHTDITTALLENNTNLANSVMQRDDEVDRLYFLLTRLLRTVILNPQLSEKMGISLIDCLDYRMISSHIEAIGDYTSQIARNIVQFSHVPISKDILKIIIQLSEAANNMHKNAMKAVMSKTYDSIDAVIEENIQAQKYLDEIKKQSIGIQIEAEEFVSTISFSMKRICDVSIDISDIVLPR